MEGVNDVNKPLSNFFDIADKLKVIDIKMDEDIFFIPLLKSLPEQGVNWSILFP